MAQDIENRNRCVASSHARASGGLKKLSVRQDPKCASYRLLTFAAASFMLVTELLSLTNKKRDNIQGSNHRS
jgi:hypothetical protein